MIFYSFIKIQIKREKPPGGRVPARCDPVPLQRHAFECRGTCPLHASTCPQPRRCHRDLKRVKINHGPFK
jgi:hypothetical protein